MHEDEKRESRAKRIAMFKKIREENQEKDYSLMTPKEKIEYNLKGIQKELSYKGIDTSCHCHKVHCIDCAIGEIVSSLKELKD